MVEVLYLTGIFCPVTILTKFETARLYDANAIKSDPSLKQKAEDLGVPLVSEEEFINKIS